MKGLLFAFACCLALFALAAPAIACPVATVSSFGVAVAPLAVHVQPVAVQQVQAVHQVQAVSVLAAPVVTTVASPVIVRQACIAGHCNAVRVNAIRVQNRPQVIRQRSVVRVR